MKSVAIDGPSGSGKSTLAQKLAKELEYIYVDTGAMYRAIGLYVLEKGKSTENKEDVLEQLKAISIELKYEKGEQRLYLNGADVSEKIREHRVSKAASDVSAIGEVREALKGLQRDMAKKSSVIMDGRDIGTVILPQADVKIYLTAKVEERARRRYEQLKEKGILEETYEQVLKDIEKRDYNDSNREIAPLKVAEGAIVVDSTDLSEEETYRKMLDIISSR